MADGGFGERMKRAGKGTPRVGRAAAALLIAFIATAGVAVAAPREARNAPPSPEAQKVLDRLDAAQREVRTLRAKVVETRSLALLEQPQVLRGELSFERPGRIRWEYRQPETRVYVLDGGSLTGWIPSKNQVEKVNVKRYEQRLRRMVAFGQESKQLVRDFTVALADRPSVAGTDELVLVPKSRRLRHRIQQVRLAVDRTSGMPRRIEYRTADGNAVALDVEGIELNRGLAADTFALRIPPGARVVEGLSSLGFGLDAAETTGDE